MGKSCCAVGCTNRFKKGSGIKFYRFPEDAERRAKWVAAVARKDWQPSEYTWICSAHFVTGSKSNDPLSPDYVPSLFSHVNSAVKRRTEGDLERFRRCQESKRRRLENCERQAAARSLLELSDMGNGRIYCEPYSGVSTMTELSMEELTELTTKQEELEASNVSLRMENESLKEEVRKLRETSDMLREECHNLKQECSSLKAENQRTAKFLQTVSFMESSFIDNDSKVKYYTGLPNYATLQSLFNFIFPPHFKESERFSLTLFQRFLLKLRLNLGDQDLAYRLGVSQSTISRNFKKMIDVLYIRLTPLVKWHEKEELLLTMPMDFRKNFSRCVTIIDCFEVFMERPTSLKARAQTWSNYKHHNTVKFLIGIAPQGAVTYISKGWGGRVSDVHLTENCGLLENLSPGDLVLADRGFTIHESAGVYCAEVKMPPFTRGKKQLSKSQVDLSRQLSRVRIHVERVIGLVRQKYSILECTLPVNFIMTDKNEDTSMIDKIVFVCCALCNCCQSVVPFQ